MACLTMQIGSDIAAADMDDAAAATLLAEYAAAYGGPTDKPLPVQLRWFVAHLGDYVQSVSDGYATQVAVDRQRAAIQNARRAQRFALRSNTQRS